MARLINGINGAFSGKAGSSVGFIRNGQGFVRGLPRKTHKKPSQKQLNNRKAMASAQEWLTHITSIVRIGFKNYSARQHGFGNALSYLKLNAIAEDFTVDPSKAMICWGPLPAPASAELHNPEPGVLEFTWDAKIGNWSDRAIIVLYFISRGTHILADLDGNRRKEGKQVMQYHPAYSGMEADIYLGFISQERNECSNSVYLGRVQVS